jgi:hypothetical protein
MIFNLWHFDKFFIYFVIGIIFFRNDKNPRGLFQLNFFIIVDEHIMSKISGIY